MPALLYVPYHQVGDKPNIIVDGASSPSTVMTLSHWPGSDTPLPLKADSSAQIVFNYLDNPDFHVEAEAASNNHFDEDGLVGLYSLLNPHEAQDLREILLDVASAGDFGVYKERDAARISFVLSAWSNVETSPLNEGVFRSSYMEQTAVLYEELLKRFGKIIENIDKLEQFWSKEDERLSASEAALRDGSIKIEEDADIDLATVILPASWAEDSPDSAPIADLVHPMAIHNATSCLRVLIVQDKRYQYYDRYETWVQYVSRAVFERVDLSPLCEKLNAMEKHSARWHYDGVDDIVPKMKMTGALTSTITLEQMQQELKEYLRSK